MAQIPFTLDDLLAALREEGRDLSAYRSVEELQEYFGLSAVKVRKLLQRAHKHGLLRVTHRPAVAISGANYQQVVYAFDLRGEL